MRGRESLSKSEDIKDIDTVCKWSASAYLIARVIWSMAAAQWQASRSKAPDDSDWLTNQCALTLRWPLIDYCLTEHSRYTSVLVIKVLEIIGTMVTTKNNGHSSLKSAHVEWNWSSQLPVKCPSSLPSTVAMYTRGKQAKCYMTASLKFKLWWNKMIKCIF